MSLTNGAFFGIVPAAAGAAAAVDREYIANLWVHREPASVLFSGVFFVCLLSWLFVCLHYNRQPEDAARSAQAVDVLICSFTPNVRHTHTLDVHMCVCVGKLYKYR